MTNVVRIVVQGKEKLSGYLILIYSSRYHLLKQIMIQNVRLSIQISPAIGEDSGSDLFFYPGLGGRSFSSFGISTIGNAAKLFAPPPGLAVGTGFLLIVYPPNDFLGEAKAKNDKGRVFVGLSSTSSRPSPFSFSLEAALLV